MAGGFVAGGLAAAGAGAVADPAAADAPVSDGEALSKALEVERLMVLAYRQVLASGALAPDIERAIAPYLTHELEHVSTVASQLTALGQSPATGPLSLDAAGAMLSKHNIPGSLTDLNSQKDCLRLLVDLESLAEGAYFTALKTLSKRRATAARRADHGVRGPALDSGQRLRNPGQYVKAVPWPFVTGSS